MPHKLTDMRLTKKEAKDDMAVPSTGEKGPRFPFGLEIRLDNDSMKKLGFDNVPDVGEEFIVVGVGPVTSAHENKRQSGVDRSFEIQLQRIEIGPVDMDDEDELASAVDAAIEQANKDA